MTEQRVQPDRARLLTLAGIAALAAGAALVLLLQVLPPTNQISATYRTISEYGLSDHRDLFSLAVVLVAAGSAVGMGALCWQHRLPPVAAAFGALWTVGLLVVVVVPKHNWAVAAQGSPGGALHRVASVVAFVALPVAVLCAARAAFPHTPGRRRVARVLAVASLAWFGVIIGAVVVAAGGAWWQLIPLGLVERGMAVTELLALAALLAPVSARRPAGSATAGTPPG